MKNKTVDRIDMYLQWSMGEKYVNTSEEQELLQKFVALYNMAKAARDSLVWAKPENLVKWRKAYLGSLGPLDKDTGTESVVPGRNLRKLLYEIVESKIDNSIPMAQMIPHSKGDMPRISITEDYLKNEADRIFTKYVNDENERSTYVDGTTWYKVWWDSLSNTHERSGRPRVDYCTADQIVPQPGIKDWRQLEYIFEIQQMSLARIFDLYGRLITPTSSNQSVDPAQQADLSTITVVNCYYLNADRVVGKFSWAANSLQVICNEEDWQIRKLRTCQVCGHVQPQGDVCEVCGSKSFKYKNAEVEILDKDLYELYNPYEEGLTDDEGQEDVWDKRLFLPAGTEIPYYKVRMLPFVPRPAVSSLDSLYGISEPYMHLEIQDGVNKALTKAMDKTLVSGSIVTKTKNSKLSNTNQSIKILTVAGYEEAQALQCKQIAADTSQDLTLAATLYDSAKSSSGITDSFQGKYDSSATSGKAKQFQALQTAGRIESLRVMKAAAFAAVYEIIFKYLLAFSDEKQVFVKTLPDGKIVEEQWSKYMFLAKDEFGDIYYRDDFEFNSDPSATLSRNRSEMWQETLDKFTLGAFGDPSNPRTLELFWNIMSQLGYPLSKFALAGIKNDEQKLPYDIEQMLLQNPQAVQMAMQMIQESQGGGQGGAREGAGRDANGFTHAANVERTNARNAADTAVDNAVAGNTPAALQGVTL